MSRIATVSYGLLRVGVLWVVLGGCAQGFEGPLAFGFDGPGSSQGGAQKDGDTPRAGSSPMPMGGAAGMAGMGSVAFEGQPCMRGEAEACACDGGGMGTRTCVFDAEAPTEGSFGECARCSGGGGSGGSGAAGSGAAGGGSAGSGSAGSGAAGSGGSGAAGSGAAGSGAAGSGTAGSGGSSAPPPTSSGSKPAWCIFVPVPIPGC